MDNFWYLFAAYTIIWAVLFGYILMLVSRQRQLQRDVESLSRELESQRREGAQNP